MREADDAQNGENQGQAQGHQSINNANEQPVKKQVQQVLAGNINHA